jgi:epoxyqueuosine reductase
VVCVALNYHVPLHDGPDDRPTGRLARYALGGDYHELIKHKLYAIADWLRDAVPGTQTRCGVDTAPVPERELAARAGIGWVGKNTCVINERIGSWLFLGSVLTTADLPVDQPAVDRCGTCTRCIDACPTGAIPEAYQLDARRCISYLTIEHQQTPIDPSLPPLMGDWVYGCDICQEVCPWNGRAPVAELAELQPRWHAGRIPLDELDRWTKDDFDRAFRHSAVKRIRLPVLRRNAAIARANATRTGADPPG